MYYRLCGQEEVRCRLITKVEGKFCQAHMTNNAYQSQPCRDTLPPDIYVNSKPGFLLFA